MREHGFEALALGSRISEHSIEKRKQRCQLGALCVASESEHAPCAVRATLQRRAVPGEVRECRIEGHAVPESELDLAESFRLEAARAQEPRRSAAVMEKLSQDRPDAPSVQQQWTKIRFDRPCALRRPVNGPAEGPRVRSRGAWPLRGRVEQRHAFRPSGLQVVAVEQNGEHIGERLRGRAARPGDRSPGIREACGRFSAHLGEPEQLLPRGKLLRLRIGNARGWRRELNLPVHEPRLGANEHAVAGLGCLTLAHLAAPGWWRPR